MTSIYAVADGKAGAVAVQMAIDDFGGQVLSRPVVLLSADHQNKADIAASKARQWFDTENLQMLIGGTNSAAGIAMAGVAQEKKRVYFVVGAGDTALTNDLCSPYTVAYDYDTAMLSRGTVGAMLDQGYKRWFYLTADYAFGHSLQQHGTQLIKERGASVVGQALVPFNTSDFSSFMMQAQNSGAEVIVMANAGGDFHNAVKAANEFGLTKTMKIAGMFVSVTDIDAMGLKNTQGMLLTTSWDWNLDAQTRAFAKRFFDKTKIYPTNLQASDYSATLTYLDAVKAVGSTDADKVMAWLKSHPIHAFNIEGTIRPDGRFMRDAFLMQVKSPAQSQGPWDFFKPVKRLLASDMFITKAQSTCKLWK